jgi:ubiquinol-cytochrome c reductase iron-sulfur subunit
MAPLTTAASRALARQASRSCRVPSATAAAVRPISSTTQLNAADSSSYSSPFKGETKGSNIPNFGKYFNNGSSSTNQLFSYFMVGTMGAVTAAGAKSTVQGAFVRIMTPLLFTYAIVGNRNG